MAKINSDDIHLDGKFFAREAEEAVSTFFAPIRGAYEAVRASINASSDVSDSSRKPGEALGRLRSFRQRTGR
jgi:hypothetical protein